MTNIMNHISSLIDAKIALYDLKNHPLYILPETLYNTVPEKELLVSLIKAEEEYIEEYFRDVKII